MRTFVSAVFFAAALIATPFTVHAQTTATTAATAPAADAAPQLAPDGVTPEKVELTHKLLTIMDINKMLKTTVDASMQMAAQSLHDTPGMSDDDIKDALGMETDMLNKYMPKMVDAMAQVYPKVFTEQELKDMVAFYETPTGKAVLQKMPLVMKEAGPVMQPVLTEMKNDMLARMNDLIKKKMNEAKAKPAPAAQKVG